jgi:hypothetical protein
MQPALQSSTCGVLRKVRHLPDRNVPREPAVPRDPEATHCSTHSPDLADGV